LRVLVTGATGFLGSHVARTLLEAGDQVRVLHRTGSPSCLIDGLDVERVLGDVLDAASMAAACGAIDAVVHCAAQMRGPGTTASRLDSHVHGTRVMLDAAAQAGVQRFVYVSSVASLGLPDGPPSESDREARLLDESRLWRGPPTVWPYGYAKHCAELLVQRAADDGLEAVSVNPALVIGPGDRNRVSNVLIWHILRGRVPPIIPGGLNVVAVEDVAAGILGALRRGRPGERYILCGENRTLADLIRTTARLVGRSEPRLRFGLRTTRALASLAAGVSRVLRLSLATELLHQAGIYFYYSGEKARRELGLRPPRPYEPAALAAAAWYRAAGAR
jgi:dihydroflavonol-4-reductase